MMASNLKALGQRPILDETTEVGPPPAAMDRAQAIFEVVGSGLILLIVLSCAWILIRKRL
jgi:hypothetical protein